MRILLVDIETSPNVADVWGLWQQNVSLNQLRETSQVICWVAKWLGDPDSIEFRSIHHDGRKRMIRRMWKLLDQADAIVHYNGRRFDVPHLQREFLSLGLTPPTPYKQIDLLDTVKRQFRFPSNKLEHVSKHLGLEGKVQHEGHPLWVKCMAGDKDAWERMRRYNERDVTLLEDLYGRLLPWITRHPSRGALNGDDRCPRCGSVELQRRGFQTTTNMRYQRYQCKGCGGWCRDTHRTHRTTITETVIN